jgi:hypothetical protein
MKRDNKGGTLNPVEPTHWHRNTRRQALRILTSSNREQIRRLWRQPKVKRRPAERLAPRNFRSGGALWRSSRRSIQRRLAGKLAPKNFWSEGSPVEVQQTPHQEETDREAGAENFTERGTLQSLKTDAGREMRGPIIEVAVEEARGRRDSNDEEGQESCGNGNKRPAGIAAPRKEWEDFAGAMEDKGDEDDPHHATRNQVGHPVPAGHGSCRRRRWEPGKLHSELREKKELRPGGNSPSFDAATGRRTKMIVHCSEFFKGKIGTCAFSKHFQLSWPFILFMRLLFFLHSTFCS